MKFIRYLIFIFLFLLFSPILFAVTGIGFGGGGTGVSDFTVVEHTSSASLSDAECSGYKHTNQGASGTIEFTLPTVTATSGPVVFENQEAQKIEVKPQTGEIINRDSTTQTAGNEVDINAAPGIMVCYGSKNASGTAVWRCDSDGSAVDGGAAD